MKHIPHIPIFIGTTLVALILVAAAVVLPRLNSGEEPHSNETAQLADSENIEATEENEEEQPWQPDPIGEPVANWGDFENDPTILVRITKQGTQGYYGLDTITGDVKLLYDPGAAQVKFSPLRRLNDGRWVVRGFERGYHWVVTTTLYITEPTDNLNEVDTLTQVFERSYRSPQHGVDTGQAPFKDLRLTPDHTGMYVMAAANEIPVPADIFFVPFDNPEETRLLASVLLSYPVAFSMAGPATESSVQLRTFFHVLQYHTVYRTGGYESGETFSSWSEDLQDWVGIDDPADRGAEIVKEEGDGISHVYLVMQDSDVKTHLTSCNEPCDVSQPDPYLSSRHNIYRGFFFSVYEDYGTDSPVARRFWVTYDTGEAVEIHLSEFGDPSNISWATELAL